MSINNISGKVSWSSPSNIAFVKYWGKYGRQLPKNPSISMTLKESYTTMLVKFNVTDEKHDNVIQSFKFEEKENSAFKARFEKFLLSIEDQIPYIRNLQLEIESTNSFPHSAGIASSASALSALSMCLVSIDSKINNCEFDYKKASRLSRLGSGSACRSVFANYAIWGHDETLESSDDFAVEFRSHDSFSNLRDAILIVDSKPKKVSSSLGHDKMNNHPFASARFDQAKINLRNIVKSMNVGDWKSFGEILEEEALTLHALMMSSSPSFILLKPQSLEIIERVRNFREKNKVDLYFTIDAGPNIHLIYPQKDEHVVAPFLEELKPFCENSKIIFDTIGEGPKLIFEEFNG